MSNKIEQMLRKTEELLKASRNVRANTQGLSPEKAYGRLKGYHERQGKEYAIESGKSKANIAVIPPDLTDADPVYTGYGQFHPAHEIAHAQEMPFPKEKDPEKPSWKGGALPEWQTYLDSGRDPYLGDSESVAAQISSLHSRRAGVGQTEDASTGGGLDPNALYGDTAQENAKLKARNFQHGGYARDRMLAIRKVAQLRQKLIDLNIFQMRDGQWEKQTTPNAKINERQFRLEHPEEAKRLLGKSTTEEKIQKLHAVAAEGSGATIHERNTAKQLIEKLKAQMPKKTAPMPPREIKVGDKARISSKHPLHQAFHGAELIVNGYSPTQDRFHCLVVRNGKAQSRQSFHRDHLELV